MKKRLILFVSLNLLQSMVQTVMAQDIHFSQFNYTPLLLNPALAGAFDGEHRAIINYKDQWNSISQGKTYRTSAIFYDTGLFKKKWKNSYIGLGVFLFNDRSGEANMGITQANISISNILSLDEHNRLSAGLQAGFGQRSIDFNNPGLMWDNQYNGNNYDPTLPSGETNFNNAVMYPDVSGGIAWNYGTDQSNMISNNALRLNLGVAMQHVNKPEVSFDNTNDRLDYKIVIHGGAYIGIKNSVGAIIPSTMYMIQGPHQEINTGLMFRHALKEESKVTSEIKEIAILAGGYLRLGDAFIPSVAIEYSGFVLGVTYDVNVSGLKVASQGKGGIELALKYVYKPQINGEKSNVRFL